MADETTQPSSDASPQDSVSTEQLSPCADAQEDPEQFIGDEIQDPWDDIHQKDWPQNEVSA